MIFSQVLEDFTMVRADFQFQVGQKIGVVVFNPYPVKPFNPAVTGRSYNGDVEITEIKLKDIYGPGQAIVIHRGLVSFVGEHHIEYGINTYPSCPGAVVFLLDCEGQPASVLPADRGKAIAVHAGKHPEIGDISVAFKFPSEKTR